MAILRKKNGEKQAENAKAKIVMPKSVTLSTKVLKIDKSYQRLINYAMVQDIRDNFDPDLFQSIIVSERDGEYYVVDGGHRFLAVEKLVNYELQDYIHTVNSERRK